MSEHITLLGRIFMGGAWTAIIGLNIFCFYKIFKDKKEDIVDPLPELDEKT